MNLLLFEPEELAAADPHGASDARVCVTLRDRRADHLRRVLRVAPGSFVRVGVLGGGVGRAEVLAVDDDACALAVSIESPAAPRWPVRLILAVPRPKVLLRTVAIAASFGIERIDLTNSWRVDKSYLDSPALGAEALARAAREGAEQGAFATVPELVVHRRLMAMFEELAPAAASSGARIVAHPRSAPLERAIAAGSSAAVTLALGPEGGFIQREVETFERHGFAPVSLGEPILRVEAAVACALGQLQLLQRLSA